MAHALKLDSKFLDGAAVSEHVLVTLICNLHFLLLSTVTRLLGLINWPFFVTSERALSVMSETISEKTCREWFQRFKSGDFDDEDRHGVGKK